MRLYVVGFLFNSDRSEVVLIRKNRPDWQAGKLNGIGGKIEDGEGPNTAMMREFLEETGHEVMLWNEFATLSSIDLHGAGAYRVHFFRAFSKHRDLFGIVKTTTDEEVVLIGPEEVAYCSPVPNLNWLVPMALTMDDDSAAHFRIEET